MTDSFYITTPIYYVNDVLAWDNGTNTELFVGVGSAVYGDSGNRYVNRWCPSGTLWAAGLASDFVEQHAHERFCSWSIKPADS